MATISNCYMTAGSSALAPERGRRVLNVVEGGNGRGLSAHCTGRVFGSPVATRQSLAVLAALVLCVAIGISTLLGTQLSAREAANRTLAGVETQTITVSQGESLSSIASRHAVPGVDTAQLADWISARNGLASSMLSTGQTLVVPV